MEIIFISLYTLVVHAITLFNTHLLIIVCATCGDTINSWKILYSEEFKDCVVLHNQANLYASHYNYQYFRTSLTCNWSGYTRLQLQIGYIEVSSWETSCTIPTGQETAVFSSLPNAIIISNMHPYHDRILLISDEKNLWKCQKSTKSVKFMAVKRGAVQKLVIEWICNQL